MRGFSHIEVLVSTLIVGGMMVTGMNLLGAVVKSRSLTSYRARGALYAQEMICEVSAGDYIDDDVPVFGPEVGETTGNRLWFDDVDDYSGWTETPLRGRDAQVIANTTGWQRNVTVAWVNPASPSTVVGSDQGVKRVTVTVLCSGQTVATAHYLRADN